MNSPDVILVEFNELSPSLLQRFMRTASLPNFKRFYESSTVYTTDAQEEYQFLEPWIQWLSIHSGVPFREHNVFHLGDGRQFKNKCLAELLSDKGIRVGIFGSMNQNYRELNGYVLADPWDKEQFYHPSWLRPFYSVISNHVQDSSKNGPVSKTDAVRLAAFMLQHGLRAETVSAILKQLLAERKDSALTWRRAVLLDRLQYDLFRHLNSKFNVQFATFFSNSTAHFQHAYWRSMEPDKFEIPPPEDEHQSLKDAILYGYRAMDRLVGQMVKDYPSTLLILCTGLSQEAWPDTKDISYRPKDFKALLDYAGVPASAVPKPVMAAQFQVDCENVETALVAEQRLKELSVDGEGVMSVNRNGTSLFVGPRLNRYDSAVLDRPLAKSSSNGMCRFGDLFYKLPISKTGRHHPDGVLWIRNGHHRVVQEKVPTTAIAPTILSRFNVRPPDYMLTAPIAV